MLKCNLVLEGEVTPAWVIVFFAELVKVIDCFPVDPIATEHTRSFTFLFADNFSAANTIIDEWVQRAHAVA